jgi:ubiquinone/menaquinone biosynthesis C-methylase UbiE
VADSSYLPGYIGSAARMMAARCAAQRAAFVPRQLLAGARMLDVGCGPGSITAGLAEQMGRSGRLVALDIAADPLRRAQMALEALPGNDVPRWVAVQASVYALPVAPASVELVFAHALFEHLREPAAALGELRRVLEPGGALALVASDWSGARPEPNSSAARQAIEGYRRLRRRVGGDPDAGAQLANWVTTAGFTVCHQRAYLTQDMPGGELATYIAARLALPRPPHGVRHHDDDEDALSAAHRWAGQPAPAAVFQRWVEVLATPTSPHLR